MNETRVSKRWWLALLAPAFVIAAAVTCSNDDNNVAGPGPTPNRTPTPGTAPTPTPGTGGNMSATVDVGQGGGNTFMDQLSGNNTTTIRAGGTVTWVWASGSHSTTSGTCPPTGECTPDGGWDSGIGTGMTFSHTFATPGSFPYFCRVHEGMMSGTVVVQ
jgi:plastocyanin